MPGTHAIRMQGVECSPCTHESGGRGYPAGPAEKTEKEMDFKQNISRWPLAVAVLSAAAFSGCTRDSIDTPPEPVAGGSIAFAPLRDDAASTRAAAATRDDMTSFAVTAFYNKGGGDRADALAFDNQHVHGGITNGWTYTPPQYWPGNPDLKIRFFALSPYDASYAPAADYAADGGGDVATDTEGNRLLGSVAFSYTVPQDRTAQQDLLYAVTDPLNNAYTYADDGTAASAAAADAVPLTFKHAMAQISFKVRMVEGVDESYTAQIKSVKLYAFYTGSLVLYPDKTKDCSWSVVRDSETGSAVIWRPFTLTPGNGLQESNGTIDNGTVPTFNIAASEKSGTLAAKAAPFNAAIPLSPTDDAGKINDFLFMLPQQPPVVELYRPSQLLMPVLNIEYRLDNGLEGDEWLYTDKSVSFSLTDLHLGKESKKYSDLEQPAEGTTDTPDWPWIWEPGKAYCYVITISTADVTLNILPTDWIDGNEGNYDYEFK